MLVSGMSVQCVERACSAASVSGKAGHDAMLVLKAAAAVTTRASSFSVSLVLSLEVEVEVGSEATSCLYDSPSTAL